MPEKTPTIESYVDSLMKLYLDTEYWNKNVISQLGKINHKYAAEALVSIIKDKSKDYTIRADACAALKHIEVMKYIGLCTVPDLVPALIDCINYQEIREVTEYGSCDSPVGSYSVDFGYTLRYVAIDTLAELIIPWIRWFESNREWDEEVATRENFNIELLIKEIIKALCDNEEKVYRSAEYALIRFGKYSIKFLVEEIKDLSNGRRVGRLIEEIRELSNKNAEYEEVIEYYREKQKPN